MDIFQEGTFRPDRAVIAGKLRKVYIDGVNQLIFTPKEFQQAKNRYKVYRGLI